MKPNSPPFTRLPAVEAGVRELSFQEKIAAFLHSDPFINTVMAGSITVGFLHGWLKLKFPSAVTTFLFDALLIAALGLVYLQKSRRGTFIPAGPIGSALKAFYLLCMIYMVLPLGPPMLVHLAAVRGWCFATLMFVLGYRVANSIAQVKAYFIVLIILGVGTAIYGIRQTPEEVEKMQQMDANFAGRYKDPFYYTSKGRQLRAFSTFVSPGAFGGTMAYVIIFGIVLLSDPQAGRLERFLMLVAIIPIAFAMVKSGSRSALISVVFGFALIAWYRRNLQNFVLIPACIVLALKLGSTFMGGSTTERYSALLNMQEVYARNAIPTSIGWEYMSENLLGGGLGKSTYSVPAFISARANYSDWVFCDGDLGRLMIELGVPGLIFFGMLIWAALKTTFQSLNEIRDASAETVGLASGACIIMSLGSFPSGSPFLGIPMGALVWFFLGTLQKISETHTRGRMVPGEAAAPSPVSTKHFLYRRGGRHGAR